MAKQMTPVPDSQPAILGTNLDSIIVLKTYQAVWEEYYSWSTDHARDTLTHLSRPARRFTEQKNVVHSTRLPTPKSPKTQSVDTCVIVDYDQPDSNGPVSTSFRIQEITLEHEPIILPYPPYTFCTPTSTNILVGDDPHYMPFMPFADDPNYNYENDLEQHKYLAWQKQAITSDHEVILLETVKRLLSEHKLTALRIDTTGILPTDTASILGLAKKRYSPTSFRDLD
ncbi:hypothetical protein D9613_008895 [Agrocybe pediades]|uniref:Uncharacterized protein n=1 Tax=Agrocybe pediades TaxID=84607 RepID=A0A8H4VNY4_9AGAR|nr:hypothetical protein D9613_008895 [Agrocybe pediades]